MVVKTSSKSGEPIIQVRDLVNRFGTHTVHQALNLDVYRGEILGIVGGSGTGKSVLLRSLVDRDGRRVRPLHRPGGSFGRFRNGSDYVFPGFDRSRLHLREARTRSSGRSEDRR